MKISNAESEKASTTAGAAQAKILPESRPRGSASSRAKQGVQLSPLERGMAIAEAALRDVPDTRDELVKELKERIQESRYEVSGKEVAEMMIRRLRADKIR